jgi:perosamine synthetase
VAQLKKLPEIIRRKQEICDIYNQGLGDISQLQILPIDERCEPVYWFTSYYAQNRAELETFLLSNDIQTRRFFCPLHMQPCYKDLVDPNLEYPISEKAYEQGISLPSAYGLKPEHQAYVIEKIREFYLG